MNVSSVFDVAYSREKAKRDAIEDREKQIFFNKCLRHINGEDAYHFLAQKAATILGCKKPNHGVYAVVNYYFDNLEYFDCSFEQWLTSDNGPIVRWGSDIRKLFPELAMISDSKFEIAKMAEKFYGVEIELDWEGEYMYSLEFNFKEINSKRVKMDEVQEIMKNIILEKLGGE